MRVEKRAPELSLKDLVLKHLPAVIKQISENGRLSFTQRDVFYAIRPLVQQAHEKSLNYGYFTALITDYENEHGEIDGPAARAARHPLPSAPETGDPAQHRERRPVRAPVLDLQQARLHREGRHAAEPDRSRLAGRVRRRNRERGRLHHSRRQGSVRSARHLERAGNGVLCSRRRRRRHDDLPHAASTRRRRAAPARSRSSTSAWSPGKASRWASRSSPSKGA